MRQISPAELHESIVLMLRATLPKFVKTATGLRFESAQEEVARSVVDRVLGKDRRGRLVFPSEIAVANQLTGNGRTHSTGNWGPGDPDPAEKCNADLLVAADHDPDPFIELVEQEADARD